MHPKTCICLIGPTASGKTDLAITLAEELQAEIISVDSALVYRGMDIGTAKPSTMLRQQVKHYLIDILDPTSVYSVGQFLADATQCIEDICARGKLPLLVGGTMMYFHALQQGIANLPESDPTIRLNIEQKAAQEGWGSLYNDLLKIDPVAAANIRCTDPQRIGRALEVYYISGKPLSIWHAEQSDVNSQYIWKNVVLYPQQRAWLHERIRQRFNHMIDHGMVDEVQNLLQQYPNIHNSPSMRAVGYRQILAYLQGDYDEHTMVQKGLAATRQLAKRQCTWLKSWNTHIQLDPQASIKIHDLLISLK